MKYGIDAHSLIWLLEGNPRLGENERAIFSDASSPLILPAIALAEAVWVVQRGRTLISSANSVVDAVNQDERLTLYPLDQAVIEKSVGLVEINEMHDRQIVATALVLRDQGESVALLTCDRNIAASGLVEVIF